VVDVHLLLEVLLERHVHERTARGRQLHARGEPALRERDITRTFVLRSTRPNELNPPMSEFAGSYPESYTYCRR
jgi:hypothetical protein